MKLVQGFFMAWGMFTIIPCPYKKWNEKARKLMLVCFPAVGAIIGILWYALYLIVSNFNLPLELSGAVLMLFPFVITGFIHLDGFMDTSDAILSGRPLEEKLRILKDPHTGAFAVISLGVLFIMCFAAMNSVLEKPENEFREAAMLSLVFIPVITRCCSSVAILIGKPLTHSQYNENKEKPKAGFETLVVAVIGLGVIIASAFIDGGNLSDLMSHKLSLILLLTVMTYMAAITFVKKQLGGISGDLAGYALTLSEGLAMIFLAILI